MDADSLFGSEDESDSDSHNKQSHSEILHQEHIEQIYSPINHGDCGCENSKSALESIAQLQLPGIQGLHLVRSLIPFNMQKDIIQAIIDDQVVTLQHPQAMLFPRFSGSRSDLENCPPFLAEVVDKLPKMLSDILSIEDLGIVLDEKLPLQTIVNLYEPGQGISPHVRFKSSRDSCGQMA